MKLYSAAQMRDADTRAAATGVPTAQLMDAAGKGVAHALLEAYPSATHVLLLCGRGNNGGDGYVAASELSRLGRGVRLYELEGAGSKPGDAAAARSTFIADGGAPEPLTKASAAALLELLRGPSEGGPTKPTTVVVDALFGTGLARPLEGWLGNFAQALGSAGAPVLSVDVPSGLNADLAEPIGPHVTADFTVELAGHKPAALFYPSRHAYGRRKMIDIGVPPEVLEAASDTEILTAERLAPHYPQLAPDAHKYSAGTVTVVAGSPEYLGAAELTCRAAWRVGAGLVTLVGLERFAGAWPETIFHQHDPGQWPPPGLEKKRASSMVVGPGLHRSALGALGFVLEWAPGPVVLDATALDPRALNAATGHHASGPLRGANTVLTPHAGEAARLLAAADPAGSGDGAALVTRDPLTAARRLAELYKSVVVLKGPTTAISHPDGRMAVSTRGTPALATGGTGDVLAGLIAALLARPGGADRLFHRACLGVWLHGYAGELAALQVGDSLIASDVVAQLPVAVRHLTDQRTA